MLLLGMTVRHSWAVKSMEKTVEPSWRWQDERQQVPCVTRLPVQAPAVWQTSRSRCYYCLPPSLTWMLWCVPLASRRRRRSAAAGPSRLGRVSTSRGVCLRPGRSSSLRALGGASNRIESARLGSAGCPFPFLQMKQRRKGRF